MSEITNEFDQPQNEKTENLVLRVMDDLFTALVEYLPNDGYAFKGGYVLMNTLKNARSTTDIDLSISSLDTYNICIQVFTDRAEDYLRRGIISKYEIKEPPTENMSGGVVFYDTEGKVLTKVDVGYHQTNIGVAINCIHGKNTVTFSPERMMTDKICATYSRKRFRRMKDFYDIYLLINNYTFSSKVLGEYISTRANNQTLYSPFIPDVVKELAKAWDKLIITSPYNTTLQKPTIQEVLTSYEFFITQLWKCIDQEWDYIWADNHWTRVQ